MKGSDEQGTYYSDDAVGLQERLEVLEELEREQRYGLGAAGEHVVDYVVELVGRLVNQVCRVSDRVRDDGRVVGRELEVFSGELVHDGVDLDHRRVYAVCHEGCRCGTDAEPAGFVKVNYRCAKENQRRVGSAHITRALASLSGTGSSTSTSLTPSSIVKTP